MTTDITIEAKADVEPTSFEAFADHHLPRLARGVAVVAGDDGRASRAVEIATRSVLDDWSSARDNPERDLYGRSIRSLIDLGGDDGPDSAQERITLDAACQVAFYGLDWPTAAIAESLELQASRVRTAIDQASSQADGRDESDLPAAMKARLQASRVQIPDAKAMVQGSEAQTRRKRLSIGMICVLALVLVLVALGQFGSRSSGSTPSAIAPGVPTAPSSVPSPAAVASTPPAVAPTQESLSATAGARRPTNQVTVVAPQLIADDGVGGFVGLRRGDEGEAARIEVSPVGSDWRQIGTLDLGEAFTTDRFERSGDHYVVWLSGRENAADGIVGTIAVTSDLDEWSVIDVAISQPAPQGLEYSYELGEVAVHGDDVLALITNTVEVDFAALQLVESNTCGHSIESEAVIVKLCNGGEIDVLDVAGVERVPPVKQLFVGREAETFVLVEDPPVQDDTTLISTTNAAIVADSTGRWVAASPTAQGRWTAIDVPWPHDVLASDTNTYGHVVSIGREPEPSLWADLGTTLSRQPLADVLPSSVGEDVTAAVVGEAGGTWVVWLSLGDTTWILSSPDGLTWKPRVVARISTAVPDMFVGDRQVILRWSGANGQSTMVAEY